MSTGADEHGLQALALAVTSNFAIPKIFANHVFVLAEPVTVRLFGLVDAEQSPRLRTRCRRSRT